MRVVLFVIMAVVTVIVGCRTIDVEKHDPVVVTSGSDTIVVPGGWEAHYRSYGMFTTFGSLDIVAGTNGTAAVRLSDLNSDVSSNTVYVIEATGEASGEIIRKIIEGLK